MVGYIDLNNLWTECRENSDDLRMMVTTRASHTYIAYVGCHPFVGYLGHYQISVVLQKVLIVVIFLIMIPYGGILSAVMWALQYSTFFFFGFPFIPESLPFSSSAVLLFLLFPLYLLSILSNFFSHTLLCLPGLVWSSFLLFYIHWYPLVIVVCC